MGIGQRLMSLFVNTIDDDAIVADYVPLTQAAREALYESEKAYNAIISGACPNAKNIEEATARHGKPFSAQQFVTRSTPPSALLLSLQAASERSRNVKPIRKVAK